MRGRIILPLASALVLAGCGGGEAPKSEAGAIAQTLQDGAQAVADRDGERACSYLTPDAQRQVELQFGTGQLGSTDCATLVNRATLILSPLERSQIGKLEPTNIQVSGSSASATLAGQNMSVQLNLQKAGEDWKVSGFANAQGAPGALG